MLHSFGLHNCHPFILPNSQDSPLLLLKFLLFLNRENLIPLFLLDGVDFPVNALVYNRQGRSIPVVNIVRQFQDFSPIGVLFFSSHFLVNTYDDASCYDGDELDTFLLFTTEGLVLENQREEYDFIPWKSWQGVELYFDKMPWIFTIVLKPEPFCGKLMTISCHQYHSNSAGIESSLPLLLGYFVLKKIWDNLKGGRLETGRWKENILPLNSKRLLYIVNNILPDIKLTKEELGILIESVLS